MSKKRKHLSDAEIWDDSALIDSWNEALAEYKYYHSLHARGERVEDVLREADAADAAEQAIEGGTEEFVDGEEEGELEDGEVDDAMGEDAEDGEVYEDGERAVHDDGEYHGQEDEDAGHGYDATYEDPASNNTARKRAPMIGPQKPAAPTMPPIADVPQAVLGDGKDEAMKNLMMSWYYAGYYTGFYEGQKQAGDVGKMSDKGATGQQKGKNG